MKPGNPQAVEQLFNDVAANYDFLNDLLSLGLHRLWKRKLLSWVEPLKGQRWVDLCCGTGDMTFSLARKVFPGGEVLGLDSALKTLEIARLRSKKENELSISWQLADALNTGLPSSFFDGGVMAYGLRNLSDPARGLAELRRLLRPGARAGILDFNPLKSGSFGESFQRLYLRKLVVPVSGAFGLKEQYAYLEESLKDFPDGKTQEHLALKAGFAKASHTAIAFGQMGLLRLTA